MRFYEVGPHVIRHDEYYQSIGFMVNQAAYEKLPDALKDAINRAYAAAGEYSHEVMGASADASIARMKEKGVTFVDVDRAPFVQVMSEYYPPERGGRRASRRLPGDRGGNPQAVSGAPPGTPRRLSKDLPSIPLSGSGDGVCRRAIDTIDGALGTLARWFLVAANVCLVLMLAGTAATIVLRPLDISYYWIWPWTMQFFVWMSFVGFFVVYRLGKDIAVDFVVMRLGSRALGLSRWFVDLVIVLVTGTMLLQMPTIFESQVGVIDGVVTPLG